MSGFNQNLLNGTAEAFGSPFLRDYAHASRTFTPNSYQNAPKLKFLFHTYFVINQEAWRWYDESGDLSTTNFGLLVKEITLPNYIIDSTTLNQYNRKRVVQHKIKYNPIDITFHDDNANQATRLWEAYYRYNYRDGNIPLGITSGNRGNPSPGDITYNNRNIYDSGVAFEQQRLTNWGYIGESDSDTGIKVPFFKNITVFGMNQHNFTAYTLINPIITTFNHDTYNYSEGSGIMQNKMTIDYETVVYNYGSIDGEDPGNIIKGFGSNENYDGRLSPITSLYSNSAILGQGGLVDANGGTVDSTRTGRYIYPEQEFYANSGNQTITKNSVQELLKGIVATSVNPETTRNLIADIPKLGSTPSSTGVAGAPVQSNKTGMEVFQELRNSPSNLSSGSSTAGNQI
jgi:hypothetical protein